MASKAKSFFEISTLKPAYGQGLRGALVWSICLLAGFYFDQILLGIQAGFVGWIVSFCDDSKGASRRFVGAAILTLVAAIATFLATVFGNTVGGSVLVTIVLGSVASLAAVAGPAGAKKGLVVMFLALFAVGVPGDLQLASELFLVSLAGGIATMLAMFIWLPFGRTRNQLLTAAHFYKNCADLADLYASDVPEEELSAGRVAFTGYAQEAYLDAVYSGLRSTRSELVAYLDRASDIVKSIVTFHDVRTTAGVGQPDSAFQMYSATARLCEAVSQALAEPGLHDIGIDRTLATIDAVIAEISPEPTDKRVGMTVLLHLRGDVQHLLETAQEGVDSRSSRAMLGPSPWEKLVATLKNDTPLRRHMLRYVTLLAAATAFYKMLDIPDGFFITIGINIMLQPDLGNSVSRLRAYALGTIAGSAVGAVIGVTLDSLPIGLTVATFITIFLMISFTRVTWWAFAVGASVFIVSALGLLVEGGYYLGMWRVLDTLIAAVFVTIGMFWLWPTRGKTVATKCTADAMQAIARYLGDADSGDAGKVAADRQEVVRAANALGQRVQEYSREPSHDPLVVGVLRSTLIDVQHMFGLVTEISKQDLEARDGQSPPILSDLQLTKASVIESLEQVADGYAVNTPLPRLPNIAAAPDATPHMAAAHELVSVGVIAQSLAGHLPIVTYREKPQTPTVR